MYAKNQGPNSKDEKVILLTLFNIVLKEVMYAIKRDLLGFNGSWEDYMQEIKGLSQEIRKI